MAINHPFMKQFLFGLADEPDGEVAEQITESDE